MTEPTEPTAPQPCSPCRGTGRLISKTGGAEHEVTCPWCEGGGLTIAGHDAQEAGVALRAAASGSAADG